ncbi:hypothetical protein [Tateyamaria omphalii]|uniref:hypothetical protein n=1 Tax=Tateyamaria omphalii TaxID=299262 RepID=UPI0012F98E0A|nr:hypothetical protein [Tateyamaria omphalii]
MIDHSVGLMRFLSSINPMQMKHAILSQGVLSGAFAEVKRGRPSAAVKIGGVGWSPSAKRCVWSASVVVDPTDNIISTPVPGETGPNIVAVRPSEPTPINPNSDEATQRGHRRENDSARILGQNGFDIIQNPAVDGPKH